MALYIDSALIDDVARACATFPIAGVTTNPTIMRAAWERGQRLSDIQVIKHLLPLVSGDIFAQPTGAGDDELYAAASAYLAVAPDRVVPKLPMTPLGLRVGRLLVAAGGRVSYTAVASLSQAYCASLAGARWIIPYFGRLRRSGVDPIERINHMARLIGHQGTDTHVLVASLKSASDVTEAVLAGAHDVTTPPDVIESLAHDDLTTATLLQFDADWTHLTELQQNYDALRQEERRNE